MRDTNMQESYEHIFDITFRIPARNISFAPKMLISFIKKCEYFKNFIPSYELTVEIEDKMLYILTTYDKELTVFIKNILFYGETSSSRNNSMILDEQEFVCYYDKNTLKDFMAGNKGVSPNIDEPLPTESKPSLGEAAATHKVKFYLLLKTDLKMKTFIHNYIFGSEEKPIRPIDAVATIIDQNPYITKCLIDEPDNNLQYTDLIVEPAELKDAIRNIQRVYGLYSKSLELFYDNGILYVLNKFNIDHSYQDDEINTIYIKLSTRKDNPVDEETVTINKDKGFIKYNRFSDIQKEDYEAINGIFSGNKFVFSNYGTVVNSMFATDGETEFISPIHEIDRPRSTRVDIGTKKIIDYDMLNNPYNMSSYVYEDSKGVPITFSIAQINPTHFTPNKKIFMQFDSGSYNKLYSGIYNIESATFVYNRSPHATKKYNAFSGVVLTLCNKQEGLDKNYEPLVNEKTDSVGNIVKT
jgi:hypothetical protein